MGQEGVKEQRLTSHIDSTSHDTFRNQQFPHGPHLCQDIDLTPALDCLSSCLQGTQHLHWVAVDILLHLSFSPGGLQHQGPLSGWSLDPFTLLQDMEDSSEKLAYLGYSY